jgi:hypothetical protein
LGWVKRGLFWVASLLLLLPSWNGVWLIADAVGVVLALALVVWEWNRSSVAEVRLAQSDSSGP